MQDFYCEMFPSIVLPNSVPFICYICIPGRSSFHPVTRQPVENELSPQKKTVVAVTIVAL